MGKSQSRFEEAQKEIADIEAKGDSVKLMDKLKQFVRLSRAQGELVEAAACLNRLLVLQESNNISKLEIANTMYLLGNTLRLQVQGVIEYGNQPNPFPDEKERTKAFARAEDLLIRSLEIREEALKNDPENKDLKMAVAKTKSALAMIENSYGAGRFEHAQKQHEDALNIFAEFPLNCDPDGWAFVKGNWFSQKLGVSTIVEPLPSLINSKPTLTQEDSVSFRIDSRPSNQELKYHRGTTNTTNLNGPHEDELSYTDDDPSHHHVSVSTSSRSTKWRLVFRFPRTSERRPSAIERLKRIGSFQTSPNPDTLFEGIVLKIDLEPGFKVEVGMPLPEAKVKQLEAQGVKYLVLGPKEKLAKIVSERHCRFEEDETSDDGQTRWICTDLQTSSSKTKGILINGVRVNRAPLRAGDVLQIGNCSKIKIGSSSTEKNKTISKDPFAHGLEYLCERVITTIEDTDVSSLAPSALFATTDSTDTAFKHFHVLAVGAQMNLNGSTLTVDQTSDLFALAIKNGIPFNHWDSWVYSELSKIRLVS